MRYTSILCLFVLLLPIFLPAQVLQQENPKSSQLKDPDNFPFSFFLSLGLPGATMSYDHGYQNLYELFETKGVNLPRYRSMLFYGAGIRYKRVYAGASLSSLIAPFILEPYGNPKYNMVASQSVNMFNVGFSIFQNRNSALILKAGIGDASSSFWITPLEGGIEVDFDQIEQVAEPIAFPHVFHKSMFLDLGIELLQGRAKSRTSLSQNIQFGYRRGLNEESWQAVNASSVNAPIDRFGQFYVQVFFLFGANFPKKNKS
ncbi:MAG: hypothetical protein AAF587_01025 [Bacteroidota bacterium]